jgi:hypothetical protein
VEGTFLGFGADYQGVMDSFGSNPHQVSDLASVGTVSVTASYTGITGTSATGGGQPFSILPPSLAINYLIKD